MWCSAVLLRFPHLGQRRRYLRRSFTKGWNFVGLLFTLKFFAIFASYSVMYLICFNRKVVFQIAYHQCKMNIPEDMPCLSVTLTPAQGCKHVHHHPPTRVSLSHQYGRKYIRSGARRLGFELKLLYFLTLWHWTSRLISLTLATFFFNINLFILVGG